VLREDFNPWKFGRRSGWGSAAQTKKTCNTAIPIASLPDTGILFIRAELFN